MTMQRGFTIIELLITVTIVAILSTLAGPSFTEMLKNNRLTTQTNDLILAMNITRSEAVKRGRAVAVTADASGWAGGWTVAVVAPPQTLRIGDPLGGTTTVLNDKFNTVITYRPSGRATGNTNADPGRFFLCDDRSDETGRRITITSTGRLSVTPQSPCF